ncbi:DUF1214 domain-containing protein [Rhizobium ruizarguesonis]|jgi:hypothetical protein|uniref:DUF1214 domain-containing protein n=1 Tax=Rhizobium ruizarguesonis TaxID=2081791 RepID=A0AAE4YUQ2_9HYPH|nr:DUF1214 domain-containing protein [Rhizobium leguminosarum]NEI51572.1 DUF1214 domain-containing protein [Rhizobium ruizarguesonis]NKK56699.1 DUF1214 domain-containing protein [Rhizobium leguminosarum bv. viciae]MBY5385589.1 DUF1214 domain-containing protein [Rhizobium leguminosarum]MCA2436408.1 DUF1214 domain-containing protein [Rhizobium leguminosarum]
MIRATRLVCATAVAALNPFDGGKSYQLRLPPNIPVKDFWSVIAHDNQTRSMVQTD